MSETRDVSGRYVVKLAKEDFKFSCAHFTVFGACDAEPLHGHNYQVGVELEGDRIDELGLLVDFDLVKKEVRRLCDELDSAMLVPARCAEVQVVTEGDAVEVSFRTRHYRFPAEDVLVLPLENTTVELFARYLWQRLVPTLGGTAVDTLAVDVAETAGQSCTFRAALPPKA